LLGACAEGLSTAELATRFWLSEGTVRNRVSDAILGKLGVRTRVEAVQVARDHGWL
jgi:two-component system response regulator DesR